MYLEHFVRQVMQVLIIFRQRLRCTLYRSIQTRTEARQLYRNIFIILGLGGGTCSKNLLTVGRHFQGKLNHLVIASMIH